MMMKGSVHQEDIVTPNVNGPRGRAGKHVKQRLRCEEREELDTSAIIVPDFSTLMS